MDNSKEIGNFDHLFRREAGNMVSALTRYFGFQNLDLVEDVVQETLITALEQWKYRGWPDNPSGWLYRVAKNKALDMLRRKQLFTQKISPYLLRENNILSSDKEMENIFLESEIQDDVLRMMFACSRPDLASESQIALTLRYICGFSPREISHALLMEEGTVNKKLFRAKGFLREENFLKDPSPTKVNLDSVVTVLYLLFSEGYHSSHSEQTVREDLCYEAMRLAMILYQHPSGKTGEVAALLALMCFQAARLPSRLHDDGSLILLKEQDRSLWNGELVGEGFRFLEKSEKEKGVTRYHLEAGIAACHCLAMDFYSTDWGAILQLYNQLLDLHPSPVVELNRALVLDQLEGPQLALQELERPEIQNKLKNYLFYHASLGELFQKMGQSEKALPAYERALELAKNPVDRKLLQEKMERVRSGKL